MIASKLCMSRREYVSCIALALVVTLGTAFASVFHLYQRQLDRDRDIARVVERSVYESFSGLVATLVSVASIQQLQTESERSNIESYAKSILSKNEFVTTVSRYEKVLDHQVAAFANEMSEFGIYNFSLKDMAYTGSLVPGQISDVNYPLKNVFPFSPSTVKYIGLNLVSIDNMSEAIDEALVSSSVSVSRFDFPVRDKHKLTLIHPTYFGREVPGQVNQRQQQHDGGYIFEVDPAAIVNSILNIEDQLSISLTFRETDVSEYDPGKSKEFVLADHDFKNTETSYLQSLFSGKFHTFKPYSRDARVQISLKFANGISFSAIKDAVAWSLLALFLYIVILTLIVQKRVAESKRNSGLKDLERQQEMALITLSSISEAVITTDINGNITFANPSSAELLKTGNTELKGKPLTSVVRFETGTQNSSSAENCLENALKEKKSVKFPELSLLDHESSVTLIDSALTALREKSSGIFQGSVLVMRDVSAERELTRELEYYATHDALTKISNRYNFEQNLRKLVLSSRYTREQHAICYIDLDQFKIVNDTCGHSAGDKLLIQVTEGLKNIIRDQDMLARLGGDEFGLLIRDSDEKGAEAIARSIYQFFQNCYFQHKENVFAVRASIGFVHLNGQHDNVEDVMAAADLACYSAKDRGRNELHIYSQSSEETVDRKDEMLLLPKLQKALRCDNFRLFVQPIVGLSHNATEEHEHFEILLRLIEDDGQVITPYQLILAAERYDLMREIDRWVIKTSLEKIAYLTTVNESRHTSFSINLSGQSTVDTELPYFISQQLVRTGVHASRLCFEITETSAIANMQHALKMVHYLHDLGCTIALDDFGSGVSSFGYLKTLPVDFLKIDGQFIKNIHNSEVDREMVKCMQAVAGLLGIHTVAEFVECAEIETELIGLNVDYAQGYHYAKPYPFDALIDQRKASVFKAA